MEKRSSKVALPMMKQSQAAFWNQSVVVECCASHRLSMQHVYPSEWHYLKAVRTQVSHVFMNTYCIEKCP